MKRTTLFFLSLVFLSLSSCTKSKDDIAVSQSFSTASALTSGTWHTDYLTRNGVDYSAAMMAYNLIFQPNGNASAANSFRSVAGSWSINGDAKTSTIVNFNFTTESSPVELNSFSGQWTVISQTSSKIAFQQVIADSPELDYLTIEKN